MDLNCIMLNSIRFIENVKFRLWATIRIKLEFIHAHQFQSDMFSDIEMIWWANVSHQGPAWEHLDDRMLSSKTTKCVQAVNVTPSLQASEKWIIIQVHGELLKAVSHHFFASKIFLLMGRNVSVVRQLFLVFAVRRVFNCRAAVASLHLTRAHNLTGYLIDMEI